MFSCEHVQFSQTEQAIQLMETSPEVSLLLLELGGDYQLGRGSSYRSLPWLYLWFLALWSLSTFFWVANARRSRHYSQLNNLLWALASVPSAKVLQLGMSLLFWHSCFKLETCSLWMSFGAYISGVLFQTASSVCFLLISLGYGIMCERLSVKERRKAASLGCVLYLSLTGYRAEVPYFTVFWLLNYCAAFYLIFHHLSQNLLALSGQLNLNLFENGSVHELQDVMHTKYTMFKKFQGAMQIAAVVEVAIYMNMGSAVDDYWYRLFLREWAQFCVFMYIGWIFRPQQVSPLFFVVPNVKCKRDKGALPAVYSLEIDAAEFRDLATQPWQIGMPTSLPHNSQLSSGDPVFIIVQNPRPANI